MPASSAEAWSGLRASTNGSSVSIDTTFSRKASNRGGWIGEGFASHGDVLNQTVLYDRRYGFALLSGDRHATRLMEIMEVEGYKPHKSIKMKMSV